jgi:hypothetical protein
MPRTPVPETPIHKHRNFGRTKHKIRFPKHPRIPPLPRNPMHPKQRNQPQLRIPIPAPPNPRHHRAAFLSVDVGNAAHCRKARRAEPNVAGRRQPPESRSNGHAPRQSRRNPPLWNEHLRLYAVRCRASGVEGIKARLFGRFSSRCGRR